jgi:hypothetical protein
LGSFRRRSHGANALDTSTKFRDDRPNRCREIAKNRYPIFGCWTWSFFRRPTRFNMGFLWAPSRVNRSNAYRYRKTSPTGPPQFGAGKSIRPLDDHLRRTVTPREGSESLRFRNRTLPSVNGNSRTDGTCQNAHWRPFRTGIRVRISQKHRDEFRFNCSVSQNSCTIFEIRRCTKIFFEGNGNIWGQKFLGHPIFLCRPTS